MVENGNNNVTDLVEVTDSLEAIAVFRGWKNIFFTISLICLFIIQGAFWVVDQKILSTDLSVPADDQTSSQVNSTLMDSEPNTASEPNALSTASELGPKKEYLFDFSCSHFTSVIRVCNGLLMLSTMLYCTTLLFSMIITVIGRLGGMRHICRAFFRALIMLVLIIPWQLFFEDLFFGCIFSPDELATAFATKSSESSDVVHMVLYYLQFSGFWLLVVFLLIASQARCARWGKSILRRLEII